MDMRVHSLADEIVGRFMEVMDDDTTLLVVSDHGEFMGVVPMVLQGDPRVADTETGKRYAQMAAEGREIDVFGELIAQVNGVTPPDPNLNNPEINASVWGEIMAAADRHNEPGKFTAFMGWEWSSTPQGQNLHRVVIMKGTKANGEKFIPYTSLDSAKPEDLWAWLYNYEEETGGRIIDSTGALELADVPDSLLVVGGGYIGLELGSVYAKALFGAAEKRQRPGAETLHGKGKADND